MSNRGFSRGLAFTATALRLSVKNQSQELSESFTKAYENTLKNNHSFVVRPVFGVTPLHRLVCSSLAADLRG